MPKTKSIEISELPRRIKIFFILLLSLFAIGTLGFKFIAKISFQAAFIRTFEALALIYHAQSGLERAFGIFLTLFGVVLLWWTLWSIFDMFLEGSFTEYLKTRKLLSKMKKMKNHYIIAGGGRVGEEIVKHFVDSKKHYIIIEKDGEKVNKLKKSHFSVINGDVSDEAVLKQANIKNAKTLVLAMPETEKNLLVTMIAKELNPDIEIYARADKPDFVSKLKKAGAKVVIVPEVAAAEKFLESIK